MRTILNDSKGNEHVIFGPVLQRGVSRQSYNNLELGALTVMSDEMKLINETNLMSIKLCIIRWLEHTVFTS